MQEPSRHVTAYTPEQLDAFRNLPTPPTPKRNTGVAKFTNEVRQVFDLEHEPLTVAFNVDASCFTFTFDNRTANLDMVQAKTLTVALDASLERFRNSITPNTSE